MSLLTFWFEIELSDQPVTMTVYEQGYSYRDALNGVWLRFPTMTRCVDGGWKHAY